MAALSAGAAAAGAVAAAETVRGASSARAAISVASRFTTDLLSRAPYENDTVRGWRIVCTQWRERIFWMPAMRSWATRWAAATVVSFSAWAISNIRVVLRKMPRVMRIALSRL